MAKSKRKLPPPKELVLTIRRKGNAFIISHPGGLSTTTAPQDLLQTLEALFSNKLHTPYEPGPEGTLTSYEPPALTKYDAKGKQVITLADLGL